MPELDHMWFKIKVRTLDFILRAFGRHESVLSQRKTQSLGTLVLNMNQTSVFLPVKWPH